VLKKVRAGEINCMSKWYSLSQRSVRFEEEKAQ